MASCSDIGISRKKKVFAVIESTCGTLEFPATTDAVIPAGDAMINQVPAFVNSEEIVDSLDIMDQFQSANPPGTWEVPMYLRPDATLGNDPQGDAFFQSMQGSKNPATTCAVDDVAGVAIPDTTIDFDTLAGGNLPERGVITLGAENIHYTGITWTSSTAGTITGCTRGYNGTVAAAHLDGAAITLSSVFYKQTTDPPAFSLWIESDHFIQGLSGATVNTATLAISNEGATMITFSGEGMQMVWAGTDELAANALAAQADIVVVESKKYSPGARIYNYTTGDDNAGAGFEILSIDYTTDTITMGTNVPVGGWTLADVIKGFLPAVTEVGSPIESRYTAIDLDGVAGVLRTTDFNYSVPKQYITDEVGITFPQSFVPDTRDITSSMNIYFRQADAAYFYDGFQGNEKAVGIAFGEQTGTNRHFDFYHPRVKIQTPEVSSDGPTLVLTMGMTALGTNGEDSLEIGVH